SPEWELGPKQALITRRQRRHTQVRHAVTDVFEGICRFSLLLLGVRCQCLEPSLGRISQLPDRDAGVAEQQPAPGFVYGQHLGDAVWPSSEQLSGQPRLECLNRCAGLEPCNTTRDW